MARGGKAKGKSSKTQLCASGEKGCVKPNGTVVWVFCEACEKWYHCPCANVDSKKATDDDFIFVCKSCKPQKEKEFNGLKSELKRQIGLIMDRHPVFSTALIARRCFTSKSASNEYHFGRPGIPVTLRELEEKTMRDVTSVDHFKHMAKVMAERMVSAVKGEFTSEAKAIQSDIEKLLKNVNNGPAALNNAVKNKRGNNKENNAASTTEEEKSSDEDSAPAPKATTKPEPKSRRGQKAKTESATTSEKPVEKPTRVAKRRHKKPPRRSSPRRSLLLQHHPPRVRRSRPKARRRAMLQQPEVGGR